MLKFVEDYLSEKVGEIVDLSSRNYSEKLSCDLLKQRISEALIFDPELHPLYYSRDDSLILILSYIVPASGLKSYTWEGNWRVRPNFHQWFNYFHSEIPIVDFFDIDEGLVGPLMEKKTVAFPADGSLITVKEFTVGPREVTDSTREELFTSKFINYTTKHGCTFGTRQGEAWFSFTDRSSALVQAGQLTLQLRGLTARFSEAGVLQEVSDKTCAQIQEINRVVTGKGSIIKYFEWGVEVLFANGNVSRYRNEDGAWVSVNNKGLRRSRKEDLIEELDPIPCAEVTDPHSLVRTMTRDDGVVVIHNTDGSWITEHADGSRVSAEAGQIFIESPGYAPIKVLLLQGAHEIETYLPDQSIVRLASGSVTYYAYDMKIIKLTGPCCYFLTGETVDWLQNQNLDVESELESGLPGVYQFDLDSSSLSVKDHLSNSFSVSLSGKIETAINNVSRTAPAPRIFVVQNNDEGYEIMDQVQVESIKRLLSSEPRVIQENEKTYHCFYEPVQDSGQNQKLLQDYSYSQVFASIKDKAAPAEAGGVKGLYLFRTLTQHPEIDQEKKSLFLRDLDAYKSWKSLQSSARVEFGVEDLRDDAVKAQEFAVKQKIIELRQDPGLTLTETFEEFKEKMLDVIYSMLQAEQAEDRRRQEERLYKERQATMIKPKAAFTKLYKPRVQLEKLDQEVPEQSYKSEAFQNYFKSKEGKDFAARNPPVARPAQPDVASLKESQNESDFRQADSAFDHKPSVYSPKAQSKPKTGENPFVSLEPELHSKDKYQARPVVLKPVTKPSVFAEVDRLQQLREQAEKDAAEEYSLIKSKNFNVYGNPRTEKVSVQVLRSSSPSSTPNARFILTESATDRRLRTISQSKRVHVKAPTVQDMRREGTHNVLYKALMKKQSYKEMIETQNMMISAYTTDPLKRSLQVIPACLRFGVVKVNEVYEMQILLKNEDSQLLRFVIRQPVRKDARVLFKPAPIAPGMFVKLSVELSPKQAEKLESEFEIATKTEIFKIPIYANAVFQDEYDKINEESLRLHGRNILKPTVKAKTAQQSTVRWGDSTSSDGNLPRLPRVAG